LSYFGKMNILGALLLLFATSASAGGTIGECMSFCNRIRKEALAEKRHCAAAIKQSSTRKMFNVCVDARKKAFDQACNPLCERVDMSISSFEGCQVIARNQGNHYVSWCRKVSGTTRAQCCNFDLRLVIDFTLETRGTIRCCKPSKLSLTTLKSAR
jgi:hypothetical protein